MTLVVAVLDACVLFPASLRDTLLRAANAELYRVHFTDEILEEVRRNLILDKHIHKNKAQRLIETIKIEFSESLVTHHRQLIAGMPNNEKDRHVLAAALACKAQIIVTQNLKDFPQKLLAPFEIKAQSADDFLVNLFHLAPDICLQIITRQAKFLRHPPKTVSELLNTLELHIPTFVRLVQQELKIK